MNKCSLGVFKPLRCALLSTNKPWQERVSFSYETGLEWILEQRKHKETVCRKVEQTEKRLKPTWTPTVTSCLDILALKYNDSSNRGCKALLMTNILMEAIFHHLCCRCILKGGISLVHLYRWVPAALMSQLLLSVLLRVLWLQQFGSLDWLF